MDRYAALQTVGRSLINMIPGITAFIKSGVSGPRFVKEVGDRVVITWTLTEGSGGIQAFTWAPTVNRIQAVLHEDGIIELSYNDVSAQDAVVGVFPAVTAGVEKTLGAIEKAGDAAVAGNLDVKKVTLSAVDGLFLKVTIETRGPMVSDSGNNGVMYRVAFDRATPASGDLSKAAVVWTIRGFSPRAGRGGAPSRYLTSGPGVDQEVTVAGNTISMKGILPLELAGATRIFVSADAGNGTAAPPVDHVAAQSVSSREFTPRNWTFRLRASAMVRSPSPMKDSTGRRSRAHKTSRAR